MFRHRDLYLQWQITDTKSIVKICKTQTRFASTNKPCFHLFIFTCVASQHLILCDITAATATTATTTTPRFLKFYLE